MCVYVCANVRACAAISTRQYISQVSPPLFWRTSSINHLIYNYYRKRFTESENQDVIIAEMKNLHPDVSQIQVKGVIIAIEHQNVYGWAGGGGVCGTIVNLNPISIRLGLVTLSTEY